MPQSAFALFNRFARITVGTVQITYTGQQTGLDVWFKAKRDLKSKKASTCDLKIWNLADATRQSIESYTNLGFQAGGGPVGSKTGGLLNTAIVPVKIEAGYLGNISTIFLGEMRTAQTVQDGTDLITELNTGDSDEARILARSSRGFPPGANAYVVAQAIIQDMNIGQGNIATVQSILMNSPLFIQGGIVKGNSMDALVDIATSCGLEVSIQGGVTQWLTAGCPLGGEAYSLSSDTGLVGSPTVDTKGLLHAETLLLPGLAPGQPIEVNAKFVQGWFRILSTECTGDTKGKDWGYSIEAGRMQLGPNTPWQGVPP